MTIWGSKMTTQSEMVGKTLRSSYNIVNLSSQNDKWRSFQNLTPQPVKSWFRKQLSMDAKINMINYCWKRIYSQSQVSSQRSTITKKKGNFVDREIWYIYQINLEIKQWAIGLIETLGAKTADASENWEIDIEKSR